MTGNEYAVRAYRDTDADDVLALYRAVFGKDRTREWFEWRYAPPWTDGARAVVATHEGRVVGVEPFMTFRMRAANRAATAVQPADAMVHPDHRRNGLLTRMTEDALARYERDAAFVFNFPNAQAIDAYRRLGWREVEGVATMYRVQNPGAFVSADGGLAGSAAGVAAGVLDATAHKYHALRKPRPASGVRIERDDGVPAATFARLHEERPTGRVHAARDEAFYRWRFSNPEWRPTSYVAFRDGDAVAALVACTETTSGVTNTKLLDAAPSQPSVDAARSLLAEVVRDHGDADVLTAASGTLPRAAFRAAGFRRGDAPPLSWKARQSHMVVRPLSRERSAWTVGGRALTDIADWHVTFAEQDVSY